MKIQTSVSSMSARTPETDASSIVWIARFCFLVLLCNQFRRVPPLIYLVLALYVLNLAKEQAEQHDVPWDVHGLMQLSRIPESVPWAQCFLIAGLSVALLSHQGFHVRYFVRSLCIGLLISLRLSSLDSWHEAFPFIRSLPFWIVFAASGYYHYRDMQIPRNAYAWRRLFLGELRSFSAAFGRRIGPSPRMVTDAIRGVQQARARAWKDRVAETAGVDQLPIPNGVLPPGKRGKPRQIKYEPLPENGIRLLDRVPGDHSRLDFRLTHTTLSAAKNSFTALSYCWGEPSRTREIFIDNIAVQVTPNLYHALSEICGLGYERLWVDAICINQKDVRERSSQVLRIFPIFQTAREVVAWLGTEDEGTRQIMQRLQEKAAAVPSHHEITESHHDDLKQFTGHAFWRRIWIIQEMAAASEVELVCGGKKASLDGLQSLMEEVYQWDLISQKNWPRTLEEKQLVENILHIRQRSRTGNPPLNLLETLVKTKASVSARVHDRVYGLLGLVSDQRNFVTEPDYELTEDQLCREMTTMWIKERGRLDIILASPRQGTKDTLPSWCPDYLNAGTKPFNEHIVKYLCGHEERYRMGEKATYWNTTGISRAQSDNFTIDGDLLHVTAVPIGMINGLGRLPRTDDPLASSVSLEDRSFRTIRRESTLISHDANARRKSDGHGSSGSPYNAICRLLLIYDPKYSKFAPAPTVLGMLYHFLFAYDIYAALKNSPDVDEVRDWLKRNEDFEIQGTKLKDRAQGSAVRMSQNFLSGLFTWSTKTMMFWHYSHVTKVVAEIIREGMPLMTTFHRPSSEHGMGWAHPEATLNDEIFLFAGCSLPVILRKSTRLPGAYRVVGHAYVDGYMDGMKWGAMKDKAVKVRIC